MTIKPVISVFFQEAHKALQDLNCKNGVPKEAAEKGARFFLEQLFKSYGGFAAKIALENVGKGDALWDERISDIYLRVLGPGGELIDPAPLIQLQDAMEPYLEAESLGAIWAALSKRPECKAVISETVVSDDPLEAAKQFRVFLNDHKNILEKIRELDLSEKQLRRLVPEIRLFTNLEALDISRNQFAELPAEIFALGKLRTLRARGNALTHLPPEIASLKLLTNLQLQENLLGELPGEIGALSQLMMLNLAGNCLKALPEALCDCKRILYLYLDNNQLEGLPAGIDRLEHLTGLYLHHNKIQILPGGLFRLKKLAILNLSYNPLGSLPESLGNLTGLDTLSCSYSGLKTLPGTIGELQKLTHLSIDGNLIEELPEALEGTNLRHLSCFNNPLIRVPAMLDRLPFWSTDPHLFPRVDMLVEPELNRELTRPHFSQTYWRLGANKWKETIDGIYHPFGNMVFDLGLHRPENREPGYMASMIQAFNHLSAHWNHILNADFYLAVHKMACAHFNGVETATWIDQNHVGVFRGLDNPICANLGTIDRNETTFIAEFHNLNNQLRRTFGSSFFLGELVGLGENSDQLQIRYHTMSAEQVRSIFNYFVTEFYYEIGHAENGEQKLVAIARWFQYNEWLHPPVDGCGRTDLAMLNYLLSCYGFHPCILQNPFVSSCWNLEKWVEALKEGMKAWENS